MIIKCIKIIFRIQRSLLKSFLVFWGPISAKISFWKKTSQNLPNFTQKWQKSRIFQISIVVWGRKMADIRPKNFSKVPAYPKFLPKFFLSPKLKNWWKYLKTATPPQKVDFLGGCRIILVTKRQKCLNMIISLMFSAQLIKFLTSSRRKSYFNCRNCKNLPTCSFEKILGKITFCDSHI